jgi:hypothetical protein
MDVVAYVPYRSEVITGGQGHGDIDALLSGSVGAELAHLRERLDREFGAPT